LQQHLGFPAGAGFTTHLDAGFCQGRPEEINRRSTQISLILRKNLR
jgi:hypothetical protein